MVDKKLSDLKTEDRVNQLLEEVRIVIPGTQVVFGFQLMVVFQELFQELPAYLKDIHLVSLLSIMLAIIFLLAPSSYDRVLEHTETVKHFRQFSRKMIMIALFLLAFGSALDLFVITQSLGLGVWSGLLLSGLTLGLSYLLWFLLPYTRKSRR